MSELTDRLRNGWFETNGCDCYHCIDIRIKAEAADEIDRLTAEVERLTEEHGEMNVANVRYEKEIEMLNTALAATEDAVLDAYAEGRKDALSTNQKDTCEHGKYKGYGCKICEPAADQKDTDEEGQT